ncbi:hypothetical protein BST95_04845 [Halioglobus japonicus]|uniref:Uncharacterized protein n=1 Tax=Halioglobus japonicus TaxID=930805 RepID=A0AAP8MDN2_9GAMM|nr:hypothetical protein BST95_04845 [Halioglobus japonicus]PLW85609.1 hypothetical protein C0029_13410 [Halioglobus japonicus]GHD16525.1 hypothetical protein GCM10007052_22060 [Halioglobus japonicus]
MFFLRLLRLAWLPVCLCMSHSAMSSESADVSPATDEVVLNNGSRFVGELTDMRDGAVQFATELPARWKLPLSI